MALAPRRELPDLARPLVHHTRAPALGSARTKTTPGPGPEPSRHGLERAPALALALLASLAAPRAPVILPTRDSWSSSPSRPRQALRAPLDRADRDTRPRSCVLRTETLPGSYSHPHESGLGLCPGEAPSSFPEQTGRGCVQASCSALPAVFVPGQIKPCDSPLATPAPTARTLQAVGDQ